MISDIPSHLHMLQHVHRSANFSFHRYSFLLLNFFLCCHCRKSFFNTENVLILGQHYHMMCLESKASILNNTFSFKNLKLQMCYSSTRLTHFVQSFSVSNISCGQTHSPGAALQEKLSKYSERFMQQGSINFPVIRYWNFYPGFQEACCQGHHHMENEIRSNPECWNCFKKHKISVDMDLSIGM